MATDLPIVAWLAATGRWLAYACTLWIGGTAMSELLLARAGFPAGAMMRRLCGPAIAAAAGLVVIRTALLWGQAWLLFALDEPVTVELVRLVAMQTAWGTGWLCQLASAVLALIGFVMRRAGAPGGRVAASLGSAGVVLSVPLTGHAVEQGWLSVALGSQMLHVAAATAWIGTLAVLTRLVLSPDTATDDADVARAIHRFSPLALAAAALLVVSGATTSWFYLGELSALWTTAYGRTLALKIALSVATASAGYVNWRRVRPQLGVSSGTERLRRTVVAEITWATVLLLITAVLVSMPMPMG